MKSLIDVVTYFAKFPAREAVMENFKATTDLTTGYQSLKTTLQNLPAPVIPAISTFLVSSSEEVIQTRLKNMKGFFLMLEYGNLEYNESQRDHRTGNFSLSLTIGHSFSKANSDMMHEGLLMQQCLDYLMLIAETMENDQFELCSQQQLMEGVINISPADPIMLYSNVGWVMSFKKRDNNWQ